MEMIFFDLAAYASTIVHAVLSFVAWLVVVTVTAALLVYNRVVDELTGMMREASISVREREDHDNGRDA